MKSFLKILIANHILCFFIAFTFLSGNNTYGCLETRRKTPYCLDLGYVFNLFHCGKNNKLIVKIVIANALERLFYIIPKM